jgi:cobalt/nickel transport system permease protein
MEKAHRMHMHLDDQYRLGSSLIHGLDPRTKVILTVLFILTVSLTPFGRFGAYATLLGLVMLVAGLAQVGPGYVLKRSVIALPFALAAVTLPFTIPGEPLAILPIFGGLTLSQEGTIRFISIVIKSWISVQMAILLVTVTPFSDILWALRALRLPPILVSIISFMYRYLFVLSEETLRLLRARAARSATAEGLRSGGSLAWRGKVAGGMAGSLMIRSFERSERIYTAMLARGYQGQLRTWTHAHLRPLDWLAAGVALVCFTAILLLAR